MNLDHLDTTNRYKLIQILGAKCRICLEDKIELLEVDHIYNDGVEERTKHGSSERIYNWYLQHESLAFKRLQPLCKECHRAKTWSKSGELELVRELESPPPSEVSRMQLFMDVLRSLEGDPKQPVEGDKFLLELEKTGKFTKEEANNYTRRMLREASIYESQPYHLNSV